ncbi:LysR family transcriptional regulator [Dongshaea marina]|uniref:LysR family transcriptional regulator n=1 Tax=Dongshaea marina TaxID=2047966 RepID=UPI00131EF02F|nr:LysR family transcriptional regulator [Dongshaea marina]
MSLLDLSRINLNLLVCLHVLLQEKSVSRAANQLCLSQSAVSKNLSQLRELTGDPLFIRQSHGLLPTSYALQIQGRLSELLDELDILLHPLSLIPKRQREFSG